MPATRETKQGKPTYKEKRFAELLVQFREEKRYLPERQAAFGAYHIKPNDDNTADSIAIQNLTKTRVSEEIARLEACLERNLSDKKIIEIIAKRALFEENATSRDKNMELLAKSRAMLTEKVQNEDITPIKTAKDLENVDEKEMQEALLSRLRLANAGIKPKEEKSNSNEISENSNKASKQVENKENIIL